MNIVNESLRGSETSVVLAWLPPNLYRFTFRVIQRGLLVLVTVTLNLIKVKSHLYKY